AAAEKDAPGDLAALGYVAQRVHVLYWGLGRGEEARAFLNRAEMWSADSQWSDRLDPWRLVLAGLAGEQPEYENGADATERALADPELDKRARRQLELAHVFRLMAAGRVKDAHARCGASARGRRCATTTTPSRSASCVSSGWSPARIGRTWTGMRASWY